MLPSSIRYWLFDTLSVQTMRYVSAVPTREAQGLTKRVYEMIRAVYTNILDFSCRKLDISSTAHHWSP